MTQFIIVQKFMNAMRPTIRYIAADRHKGIANVQFVVSCFDLLIPNPNKHKQ